LNADQIQIYVNLFILQNLKQKIQMREANPKYFYFLERNIYYWKKL